MDLTMSVVKVLGQLEEDKIDFVCISHKQINNDISMIFMVLYTTLPLVILDSSEL